MCRWHVGSVGKRSFSWDAVSYRTHQGLWWLSHRRRRYPRPRHTSLTECVTTSVTEPPRVELNARTMEAGSRCSCDFETGLQPDDDSPGLASASGSSSSHGKPDNRRSTGPVGPWEGRSLGRSVPGKVGPWELMGSFPCGDGTWSANGRNGLWAAGAPPPPPA